jgi:chromate transporter
MTSDSPPPPADRGDSPSPPPPPASDGPAAGGIGVIAVFLAFARLGLTSFGGGLGAWTMRDMVETRRWIDEAEFMKGLALSQAFPGMNAVNIAVWIGLRLAGGRGALAAALGLTLPAMLVVVALAGVVDRLTRFPATPVILAGIAAAAIGLSLHMGLRAARRTFDTPVSALVTAGVFAAVFAFRLPLVPVVLVAAPIAVFDAWRRQGRGR